MNNKALTKIFKDTAANRARFSRLTLGSEGEKQDAVNYFNKTTPFCGYYYLIWYWQ